MAAEQSFQLRVVQDPSYFSIHSNAFMVSGPIADGMLQLTFAEDFQGIDAVKVIGTPLETDRGTLTHHRVEIGGSLERVLYGRVKLNLTSAKQLHSILGAHIAQAEGAMSSVEAD